MRFGHGSPVSGHRRIKIAADVMMVLALVAARNLRVYGSECEGAIYSLLIMRASMRTGDGQTPGREVSAGTAKFLAPAPCGNGFPAEEMEDDPHSDAGALLRAPPAPA